jgi:hypothetical protein
MIVFEDENVLIRAQRVFSSLHEKAPPIALREVLEAVLGLKCSRLNVWQAGLEHLQALAREFDFGLAVSEWKMIVTLDEGKGDWSDGVLQYVPFDDPRGLFSAYLGSTKEKAITALRAEANLGDDAFGELLGIPSCCRRFYTECRERASSAGNDYLWETLGDVPRCKAEPAGANIIGQYFGRCLLSYFPCSLRCGASRTASTTKREALSRVAPQLIDYLAEGHYWSALVLRGRGIAVYPGAKVCAAEVRPRLDFKSQVIGDVPSEFTSADRIFIDADGYIMVQSDDHVVGRLPGSRARLVAVEDTW